LNGQDSFRESPEIAWLEKALGSAENEPGLVWRFVVVHFGYRSSGPHGNNPRLLAAGVDKLLKAKKIDLVLSGHDHIYERGEDKGTRYIVSGGGGAPLYRIQAPLAGTRKIESTYHFVNFVVSPSKVTLVAKRADGSVLDSCEFGKNPGWDCDPKAPMDPKVDGVSPSQGRPPASATSSDVATAAQTSRCGCAATGVSGSAAPVLGTLALAFLALRRRFRYRRS
jgi:MYXO-CTERM domain-containing protein